MFTMDASQELTPKNPLYKKALKRYLEGAYKEDAGRGDITVKTFLSRKGRKMTASIVAGESGVMAGLQEAHWFLKRLGISVVNTWEDGALFEEGDVLMKIEGRADRILSAERTLLNLLQRMSGIATATAKLAVKLPEGVVLLATRKTLWGLLDKRAVSVGGGGTHRLNLNDAILIKDNHWALTKNPAKNLKRALKKWNKVRFVEAEVDNLDQLELFISVFKKLKNPEDIVVMLDNFKPSEVKKALTMLSEVGVLVEVSGGIHAGNIKKYALGGVSAISSGAITGKADMLDISLNFDE